MFGGCCYLGGIWETRKRKAIEGLAATTIGVTHENIFTLLYNEKLGSNGKLNLLRWEQMFILNLVEAICLACLMLVTNSSLSSTFYEDWRIIKHMYEHPLMHKMVCVWTQENRLTDAGWALRLEYETLPLILNNDQLSEKKLKL